MSLLARADKDKRKNCRNILRCGDQRTLGQSTGNILVSVNREYSSEYNVRVLKAGLNYAVGQFSLWSGLGLRE